ncbi:DUF4012 domain-containing protein [Gordonia sp. NPDC003424]
MTESENPQATVRRRRWIRPLLWGLLVVAVLAVCAGGFIGYQAVHAKSQLEEARSHASAAKSSLLSGDASRAQAEAQAANSAATEANSLTSGLVWSAAAGIPWLGAPLASTQDMTAAVADLTSDVLVPSAQLSDTVGLTNLLGADDAPNLARLRAAAPQLVDIAAKADSIDRRVAQISGTWLGPVADAQRQLADQTAQTARFIDGTAVAAQIAPGMLGVDGPRHYYLALQTPAEARATGGLVGAVAGFTITDGKFTADSVSANSDLQNPPRPLVDLGSDYNDLYAWTHPYTDYRNSNISPNFPDAARIWIANWQHQTGDRLDGAVALDPIALSYILDVTGPVTLPDGEKITGENVVPITLSTSYQRFAGDNDARKAYLQTIAKAAVDQTAKSRSNTSALLKALGRGVSERRIMVYSTRPDEQKILTTTQLAHQLPDTDAPLADVTIGNVAGNKIDYYLKRDIRYAAGACSGDRRTSTITVKLTNTLTDLSLPTYVIGPNGSPDANLANGTNFANVQFTVTKGATVEKFTVDGGPALYWEGLLSDHPVAVTQVRIPAGQTATLVLTLSEPTSATGPAQVPIQPLVDDPKVGVDVPECGAGQSEDNSGE